MKQGLDIEQSLQTVQRLSPRQVQFVRLLEMTGPEVEDEVRRQIDDNPALEVSEDDSDRQAEDYDTNSHDEDYGETSTIDSASDYNIDPDDDPADYPRPSPGSADNDYFTPQIADDSQDLYTYLRAQIGEMEMPDLTRQIALYIIGNLDDNGYITRQLGAMADDIAIATGVDVTREMMKEAFGIVRSLDPAGVGAVDLRDCLLIQLRRIHPATLTSRIATDIIDHYFDLFSKMHYDRLQAQLGLNDNEEMRKAIDLIRTLNPKPGSGISPSQSMLRSIHITPDVQAEMSDDGRVSVSLVSRIPTLQIERSFSVDADPPQKKDGSLLNAMHKQAQAFVKLKRDEAESFINALKQRSNTLLSVTEAIVKLQSDFFRTADPSKLRPMILKDVAAATGLDISVISRATAGKYVATNSGVYPLKMFFNEATQDDSDTSTHKILHDLQTIIDGEDKRHPLSDEALKDAMLEKGFNLARRTVTKYREKLGIPVGRLRKELK